MDDFAVFQDASNAGSGSAAHKRGRGSTALCPTCGRTVGKADRFCTNCGTGLGKDLAGRSVRPAVKPGLPDVPGKIVGVRISHGWATAYGYHDILEIANGKAVKSRKINPARGSGQFPEGWFDEEVAVLGGEKMARIETIVQNVRFCDINLKDDGSPRIPSGKSTSPRMAVTYKTGDGAERTIAMHADPEFGHDIASQCARDVIEIAESAFGNARIIDNLLVIHRRGPIAQVMINGRLHLAAGPTHGSVALLVDGDSDEVLSVEANVSCEGKRFLEIRVLSLHNRRAPGKAVLPIVDRNVVRLRTSDFIWEHRHDETLARNENGLEEEEWIVACASWPRGCEQYIDETLFLVGYEPFMTPGRYAVTSYLRDGDMDQDAWFSQPLPKVVQFKKSAAFPHADGIGSFRDWHDTSMGLIQRKIQLEESRCYFLTVFLNEDGSPTGRYSYDIEAAHDSHYQFAEDGARTLRGLIGASSDCAIADAMIEYLQEHDGCELGSLVWEVKTASFG